MTNKHIRIGTFFSGIGSPEKALQKLKEDGIIDDYEIVFFSEIDENAIKSYCSVHAYFPFFVHFYIDIFTKMCILFLDIETGAPKG